jgi:hypothetical protein
VTAEIPVAPSKSLDTVEELREALITLRTEHEALVKGSTQAQQLLASSCRFAEYSRIRMRCCWRSTQSIRASSNVLPQNPLRYSAHAGRWARSSTKS